MATDLEQKRKNAAPAKYESFVENQLARVRGRVRALDAGRAVLLFLIVTLAYALIMSLTDRALDLPAGVRLAGFLVYLVGALCLLGWAGVCLVRPVNPYYAAVQLEHTLPDAKNSVVNWLDLRDEKLPTAIHGALGLRAARDLKKADPEQAVNSGPTWLLAGILGGLIVAVLILFVMGPQQFTSLLQRAFAPFREGEIATRTMITMVWPEGGTATVRPNRPLTFRAQIDGRFPSINQPGAPQLEYRYNAADPFAPKALEQDHDGTWYWTMPADLVINGGLSYRVTAGDAATPEYQINVSVIPQVREIDVSYVFRPYLRLPDGSKQYQRAVFPGLKAPRGTQAAMIVRTNCAVRDGTLQVHWTGDAQPTDLPGAPVPNDPTALSFPALLLDREGSFRFLFNSKESEPNQDRLPYSITIIHDKTPTVEIKKPKDVKLPANGTLSVEGSASDDFGIKSMTLGMAFLDGTKKRLLERKPYRPDFSFKLVNGTYPDALEYRDVVPLEKLKTIEGTPFPLKKDMVLEYWLEAVDNSDYPTKTGNVGKSAAYKIIILDPEKDQQKQKQDRQQAQQEKQKHDQKQNDDIDKKNDQPAKEPNKGKEPQTKPDQQNNSDAQKQEEEKLAKAADDLKEKLDKNEKQQGKQPDQKQNAGDNSKQNNPGAAKTQEQPKSDQKDGKAESEQAQEPKAKEGNKDGKGDNGQQKDAKPGQDKSSQAKDGGDNKPGQKNDATEAKGPGKENPDAGPKGEKKDAAADNQNNDAKDNKSVTKDQPKTPSAGAKDKGANGSEQKTGQAKDGGENAGGKDAKGQEKSAGKEPPNSQTKEGGSQGQKEQITGKGNTKPAPADPKDQAAAKGKEPTRTEVSEAKGPPPDRPQTKGDGKGPEKNEPVAQTKAPPGNPAPDKQPQAKNTGPNSPSPSQAKETNPGKSTSAAKDKGTGGTDSQKTDKQPSAEDIAKLKKDLKGGDPQTQKKAEDELSRLAKDAKDAKTREAAEEALREANKLPMRAKDAGEGGDKTAKSAPKEQGDAKSTKEGAAKEGTPEQNAGAGKGQEGDPKTPENAKKSDAKGNTGGTLAGNSSVDQPGTAQAPNQDFSKKIGNLTLEDMKKLAQTTAAKRKQAGIDEAQWRNFLKNLRDYEDWLRRMNAQSAKSTNPNVRGTSSALKSVGPRQINPTAKSNSTPVEVVQPLPPPEFREAQRLFTAPSQNGKKQ